MEQQISSPIWIPSLCPINIDYSLQKAPVMVSKPLAHQRIYPGQSVIIPTQSNPFLVQMPQVVPLLTNDTCHFRTHPQNLIVHPLPTPTQFLAPIMDSTQGPTSAHAKQVSRTFPSDESASQHGKVQKKKKVSPSAKRRSRLRLLAFLEAKKSASQSNSLPSGSKSDGTTLEETSSEKSETSNDTSNVTNLNESMSENNQTIVELVR